LNKTVISARGQMVSRDAVSKPFDVLRIREAVGLGSRDIGIYLDALGEKAAQDLRSIAKEKNRIDFSNQENTDWAMFTLSPDHIRFEEISEFTMNDFLKESRGIFEDEECVLMSRPHKEKTAYYYFRKADQGAGARFFYFDLPFEVDEVVVQDGMVVLRKENILFQFSFLKRSPVADFFFTLNVAPALADQWQGKLTAAYDQLLGFISKEAYGMNVDQLKLSFDIFYSLVRQRMGEVIEGKASVEDQKVAIDVLIDDVAHTLFNINKGLDDVWSDFIDENIIPLKPEEREDFYQRFFRKLLQASALGG
jgi:hypothetical protein